MSKLLQKDQKSEASELKKRGCLVCCNDINLHKKPNPIVDLYIILNQSIIRTLRYASEVP